MLIMTATPFNPDLARSSHIDKILFLRRNAQLRIPMQSRSAILPKPRSRSDSMLATPIRTRLLLDEIAFVAWVGQAAPGNRLEYHRGFMAIDTDRMMSKLAPDQRRKLCDLADAAFRAAMQDLVHLVQARLATNHFSYIAVARPRPEGAAASLSSLLLDAQAA
jgi:hypothetical protein